MASQSITSATKPDEQQRAISTIVMGFSADPIARWFLPEPHQYLTYFAQLIPLMGGGAFEHGSAYCTEDFLGASLWVPPNAHSDQQAMAELAQRAIPERDQEKMLTFMGKMGEYHITEPHWYLPLIAVDPMRQGHGYGSVLLKHALEVCDRDGLPAYLESTSPRSRPLYERHGFEAIGEIQVADSPPLWPMLRKPR
jgi:GNAT superfamily N-acetyltransferase